ncbi:MAG: hypothetical protein AVDCRST_MAG50-797, partial [uncultured Acidimicrobiales bacterium]
VRPPDRPEPAGGRPAGRRGRPVRGGPYDRLGVADGDPLGRGRRGRGRGRAARACAPPRSGRGVGPAGRHRGPAARASAPPAPGADRQGTRGRSCRRVVPCPRSRRRAAPGRARCQRRAVARLGGAQHCDPAGVGLGGSSGHRGARAPARDRSSAARCRSTAGATAGHRWRRRPATPRAGRGPGARCARVRPGRRPQAGGLESDRPGRRADGEGPRRTHDPEPGHPRRSPRPGHDGRADGVGGGRPGSARPRRRVARHPAHRRAGGSRRRDRRPAGGSRPPSRSGGRRCCSAGRTPAGRLLRRARGAVSTGSRASGRTSAV